MGNKTRLTPGKFFYGALFVFLLPILLILWADKTETIIPLPAFHHPVSGLILSLIGLGLMVAGKIALYIYGNGLPMNPYPPEKFVTRGIYRYISHPIYSGAGMLVIGISVYTGSVSGLWLISPLFILGCIALVLGFEREKLRNRFPGVEFKPLVSLPPPSEGKSTGWNKLSAYVLVLIPWTIIFQLIVLAGEPDAAVISYLPFETGIPVLSWTAVFYILAFPLIILAPLFAKTQHSLRHFMISGWIAGAIGFFMMIMVPLATTPKVIGVSGIWKSMLESSPFRIIPYAAFPSFAVIWTWIALSVYIKRFSSLKFLWRFPGILISLGCITTGLYSLTDVSGGLIVFWLAEKRAVVWRFIQGVSEMIANSWKEWDYGKIRFMNHGVYGGMATFSGILLVGMLIGERHLPAILAVAITAMIISALWAQVIEGSQKLLRPLGFYGGVLGVIAGCFLVDILMGEDFFLIWAPFAVAAPWIQGIGRLRCLIQGCCHGSPTTPNIGIRYFHQRSRVVRLADLKGAYLHPTPVYSILANVVSGVFLLKLWSANAPSPFIIGMCFILNGLSRFVEEAYRGEPQTPVVRGLRLYQWIALGGIILGAALTTIPYPVSHQAVQFNGATLLIAVAGGLLATFLTGIDFPQSNKRFSRLV